MDSTKRLAFRLGNLQVLPVRYPFSVNLEKSLAVDPDLVFLESIDSTNLELARLLGGEAKPDLFALVAAQQTSGRGRLERTWVSEPETSISLSMLLRPTQNIEQGLIPLFVGSCVASALEVITGAQAKVKWPNDVLIAGKKVCGVLSELTDFGVIAGVGINVERQAGAPETACAVADFTKATFDEVLAEVLAQLRQGWISWLGQGNHFALDKIRSSSLTIGLDVRAILPGGEEITGTALGIEPDGRLRIQGNDLHLVSAADVWHLRN